VTSGVVYRIAVRGAEVRYYIGQAVDFAKRKKRHLNALRGGYHRNVVLQRLFDKYGEDAFAFEVLLVCSRKMLSFYEQIILDSYGDKAVNIRKLCVDSQLGIKLSPECRAKLSSQRIGTKRSLGYRHTLETKAHLAQRMRAIRAERFWNHKGEVKT